MRVPFLDLRRVNATFLKPVQQAVDEATSRSMFVGGSLLTDFESRYAIYCATRFAVGTSSGTSALRLALLACGVRAGDEVITVPNTFIATVEAISMTAAKPVLVDIDLKTGNMDVSRVGSVLTPNVKAVIPVHLYGNPCDMAALLEAVSGRNIMIIEDACQAHGAEYLVSGGGARVGSKGLAGCFSFYPTKNLGAFGEGGIVVTDSENVAEKLRMLRDHGQKEKHVHEIEGSNERLHSLQAAVLGIKLEVLDEWNEERRRIARVYSELLEGLPLEIPQPAADSRPVYHLYAIRSEERDSLKSFLASRGVDTAIHYPTPVHLQPAYSHLGYKRGDFPLAEKWADSVLSLPMFIGLRQDEIEYVADTIRTFYGGA